MKPDKIVAVVLITAGITALVFSKKVTDQVEFNAAKRETPGAWKADAERIIAKMNDSLLSGNERTEYQKMQINYYDIVSNYNK